MREVVEEAMVECVDVRNYMRRPAHAAPVARAKGDEVAWRADGRDQGEPLQANASISAQVSHQLSPFSLEE